MVEQGGVGAGVTPTGMERNKGWGEEDVTRGGIALQLVEMTKNDVGDERKAQREMSPCSVWGTGCGEMEVMQKWTLSITVKENPHLKKLRHFRCP